MRRPWHDSSPSWLSGSAACPLHFSLSREDAAALSVWLLLKRHAEEMICPWREHTLATFFGYKGGRLDISWNIDEMELLFFNFSVRSRCVGKVTCFHETTPKVTSSLSYLWCLGSSAFGSEDGLYRGREWFVYKIINRRDKMSRPHSASQSYTGP